MPQQTQNDPEKDLIAEIIKLNKTLRRVNSWWRALLRGVLMSIGTVLGVILITSAIGVFIFNAAQDVNWDQVVQSAVLKAIGGGSVRNR